MKKAILYTLISVFSLGLLAGCGTARYDGERNGEIPAVSASPLVTTPNPNDGMVNDRDGIITEKDERTATASPAVGSTGTATATPGTASASPAATHANG